MGDRDEIAALVHHYAELIDAGDMDGVVAMFAAATWRSHASGAVLRTPAEIREVYDRIVLYEDGTPRTRHLMNNLIIEMEDGADDAPSLGSHEVRDGGAARRYSRCLRCPVKWSRTAQGTSMTVESLTHPASATVVGSQDWQ